MSAAEPSSSHGTRKVAIPRLQRPGQPPHAPKRQRVSRACTACRSQKIKCSGDTPQCKHCQAMERECVYVMPRRDRLKIVTDRCQQMAGLLGDLKRQVAGEDETRIKDLIDAVEEDISEIRQTPTSSSADYDEGDSRAAAYDTPVEPIEPLDIDGVDILDEDLLRDGRAQATGFVGRASPSQWLRDVASQLQVERADEDPAPATPPGSAYGSGRGSPPMNSFNFYLDSESIDVDFVVDPHELPLPDTADLLLGCYATSVHDTFPILPRTALNGFHEYFQANRKGKQVSLITNNKWQAILNVVLAIGAKYSHLVQASWQGDERDHLVYQTRARAFLLSEQILVSHPDIPTIQMTGLFAFYYLCAGQISRAWTFVGIALRFACALGLHVRNEDASAPPAKKETLVRIWWSLYSLEHLLCLITGRPSTIVEACCSVPLPTPVAEEKLWNDSGEVGRLQRVHSMTSLASPISNIALSDGPSSPMQGATSTEACSGSYFKAVVQIGVIAQNVLLSLYSAGTILRSQGEIRHDMVQLGDRLVEWVTSLPSEFNFQRQQDASAQLYLSERMLLRFSYCSTRILLTKPALSSLCQAGKSQSGPETLLQRKGNTCIEAAKDMVDLLPDQPNPLFVYQNGPWWNVVHHLMQAASVFLLVLSCSTPRARNNGVMAHYVKKLIRWLRAMQDPVAQRAFHLALNTFQAAANRLSMDTSDLWAPEPIGFAPQIALDPRLSHPFSSSGVPTSMGADASMFAAFNPTMVSGLLPLGDEQPSFDDQFFGTTTGDEFDGTT